MGKETDSRHYVSPAEMQGFRPPDPEEKEKGGDKIVEKAREMLQTESLLSAAFCILFLLVLWEMIRRYNHPGILLALSVLDILMFAAASAMIYGAVTHRKLMDCGWTGNFLVLDCTALDVESKGRRKPVQVCGSQTGEYCSRKFTADADKECPADGKTSFLLIKCSYGTNYPYFALIPA